MKNILLTIAGLFALAQTFAQGIEVSVLADATSFRYVGQAAPIAYFVGAGGPPYRLNDWYSTIYGNTRAFGYDAGIQVQYVARWGLIAGLQPVYEVLRSAENLINGQTDAGSTIGHFYLETQYISFSPYLGYRIHEHQLKIDLTAGIDLALANGQYNAYGSAFYEGHTYQITEFHASFQNDTRARLGLTAWYKKIGLTASYSHGLTNFTPGVGLTEGATHSELFRLGLCFRIL